jgi:glycosyltransferase involved in cell wall biosynthesis
MPDNARRIQATAYLWNNMHILFLSHYFPPETNAPASRTYEHTARWVREPDVKVTVITNHPNHPNGILFPGFINRCLTRESVDGIEVYRVWSYLAANAGFFHRTLNYLVYMFAAVLMAFRVPKPDVVVATSPQFFCAVAGYLVSRIKRAPFVFELRDIWPESIVTVGAMRRGLWIKWLESLELFLYRRATKIIAVTDAFRDYLIAKGISASRILVIKNGVDLTFFKPRKASEKLKRELGGQDKFILAYIGTVGMAHAVDKIVEVANRLRGNPKFLFLIVGEGAQKKQIAEMITALDLPNIKVLPGLSKDRVRDYYAVADLNLVTLKDSPVFRKVLPSKIFEIMAMARPILSAVDGECRQIIEGADSGVYVEPENISQMAEMIESLSGRTDYLQRLGENGRRCVEEFFDRDKLAIRYLEDLRSTARNQHNGA